MPVNSPRSSFHSRQGPLSCIGLAPCPCLNARLRRDAGRVRPGQARVAPIRDHLGSHGHGPCAGRASGSDRGHGCAAKRETWGSSLVRFASYPTPVPGSRANAETAFLPGLWQRSGSTIYQDKEKPLASGKPARGARSRGSPSADGPARRHRRASGVPASGNPGWRGCASASRSCGGSSARRG